jgi:Ni/Fe-hydrogenase subunit HybB-like protein
MKKHWRIILWSLWIVIAVIGSLGFFERVFIGHTKANYGSYIIWGLWVSAYIYFIGLSAGSFLLSSMIYVFGVKRLEKIGRLALFTAIITLMMALLSIWCDLGQMFRAYRVMTSPNFGSMMAWMVWLYSGYTIIMLLELWLAMRPDLARWRSEPGLRGLIGRTLSLSSGPLTPKQAVWSNHWLKVLAIVGVPLAIAFHGGVGALFSTLSARPVWHTPLMPILFLTGALVSGGGLMAFVVSAFWPERNEEHRQMVSFIGRAVLGLLVFDVVLEWAEFSVPMWYGVGHEYDLFVRILFGEFWWVFWGLHVGLGTLVPLALLALLGSRARAVGLAGLLIAVTFMTVRLNIVIPGLLDPHLRGLQTAFTGPPACLLVCAELVRMASHAVHRRRRFGALLPRLPLPSAHSRIVPLIHQIKETAMLNNSDSPNFSRRGFLARGAMLGSALMSAATSRVFGAERTGSVLINGRPDVPYDFADPEHCLYTGCLNCNTGCGIKAKIQDGIVTKIDGNPHNPWALFPHLPESASPFDAVYVDGSICPKGQSGLQTAYDPYRIRKVLKRAGRRGENNWITIDFDKAVREIVEGGRLFAHVPGEEHREVEGLASLMALRDAAAGKAMAADVDAIWNEKDQEKKKALVEQFREKHAAQLDMLIDPAHPDFGPRNNQFTIMWGRLKGGRSDFIKRFGEAFGTTNLHGHTTICQGSLYFTGKAMSEQYLGGTFTDGQKFYWQADTENARFILFVGANLLEANYGPPNRAVRLTENIVHGRTKIAVVDPRFSKLASKAWKWLPIKPGEDGALAMAFLRWMIEHERFDKKFLAAANKAAAKAAGEKSWTNATWLVALDAKTGEPGAVVRAADVGLATPEPRKARIEKGDVAYEEKFIVVLQNGAPVAIDPNDEHTPVPATCLQTPRSPTAHV